VIIIFYLVLFVVLGLFALLGLQTLKNLASDNRTSLPRKDGPIIDAAASAATPAAAVAETMEALEAAKASLRTTYPALARMFGGYLHAEQLFEKGPEEAVREMILDWQPEREAVIAEITHLLADNEDEREARAIVRSFCDLDLEQEGYRPWLIWLQGQFNSI